MYKLYLNSFNQILILKINNDGSATSFSQNPKNTDYQEYLKWLEEGNTPLPAEENN